MMKKTFRGLTLAAVMLSASTSAFADENAKAYDGDGPVTPVSYIGDVPNQSEEAYFAKDAKQAAEAESRATEKSNVAQTSHVMQHAYRPQPAPAATRMVQQRQVAYQPQVMPQYMPQQRQVRYAPVSVNQLQPQGLQRVGFFQGSSCDSGGCEPTCGVGGCDSGCDGCGGGRKLDLGGLNIAGMFGLCKSDGWARHEALLWFVENRDMPALITTADVGDLPNLNVASTQTVFGDDIDGDMSVGYRVDAGRYFGDNIGIGGRFWILGENNDSYYRAGNGSDVSIGRPFYNDLVNNEDSLIVAFQGAANLQGAVAAESAIDMMGAEGYARLNFGCSRDCQLDFIGGYSYFEVDDTLQISSTTDDGNSLRTFSDLFETENRFNGGQIGFEAIVKRGRWVARSLTKVHIGNMEQTVNIQGQAVQDFGGGVVNTTNGGLLSLSDDIRGERSRDKFAFVPEMNFKLGYRFRDHVELSAGYTFMYFDNVVLNGDVLDRVIDPSALNTNGPYGTRPAFDWNDSGLWVQGLDLGLGISY